MLNVLMEHTKDPNVAIQIATDHLSEDPVYYSRLAKMESKGEELAEALEEQKEEMAAEEVEKEGASSCKSPTPRKGSGKYMKKAPNKNAINVLSKEKSAEDGTVYDDLDASEWAMEQEDALGRELSEEEFEEMKKKFYAMKGQKTGKMPSLFG
jgi:hypothetical protein